MIPILRMHLEKVAAGAAVAVLGLTAAAINSMRHPTASHRGRGTALILPAAQPYIAPLAGDPPTQSRVHTTTEFARASRSGFDLFTAPVIPFDAVAGRYRFPGLGAVAQSRHDLPLELVEAHFEDYPIQLAGYFGPEQNVTVALSLAHQATLKLCRVGDVVLPGIRLSAFRLRGRPRDPAEEENGARGFAEVELVDERSHQTIVLHRLAATPSDHALAVLGNRETHEQIVVREGMVVAAGGRHYRIDLISPAIGEVVLSELRDAGETQPATTLRIAPTAVIMASSPGVTVARIGDPSATLREP